MSRKILVPLIAIILLILLVGYIIKQDLKPALLEKMASDNSETSEIVSDPAPVATD